MQPTCAGEEDEGEEKHKRQLGALGGRGSFVISVSHRRVRWRMKDKQTEGQLPNGTGGSDRVRTESFAKTDVTSTRTHAVFTFSSVPIYLMLG